MINKKTTFAKYLGIIMLIVILSTGLLALDPATIFNNAVENVAALETVSLELNVRIQEGFGADMKMIFKSHLKEGIARLEFLSPKEFAGQIIIVDKPKDQFINYYPTGQAISMPIDKSTGVGAGALDISAFLDIDMAKLNDFDESRYSLEVSEAVYEGVMADVLTIKDAQEEGLQKIWLDKEDGFPLCMEIYDKEGYKVITITLTNVQRDSHLELKTLRELPKGAMVFEM